MHHVDWYVHETVRHLDAETGLAAKHHRIAWAVARRDHRATQRRRLACWLGGTLIRFGERLLADSPSAAVRSGAQPQS